MIANQLPRDILLSFTYVLLVRASLEIMLTWHSTGSTRYISATIMRILHQRQRHLRSLRFDWLSLGFKWNKPGEISTENISTVQILIDNHRALPFARKCMLAMSALESLEIHVDMGKYCGSRKLKIEEELHRATASENIIAALIGEKADDSAKSIAPRKDEAIPACKKLRTLRIHGMNLSGVAVHLLQAVDIQQ